MKETDFARYLTQFLSTYLPGQVGSIRNTQLAYRDSFSLFLRYCRDQENLSPEKLTIAKVDRELILRFLQWLEDERNCKAATRNQRLAAIHSFFSFLMVEEPQYMQQSQKILAIPMKKRTSLRSCIFLWIVLRGCWNSLTGPQSKEKEMLCCCHFSTTEIYARADEKMKRKALMEAYNSPASDELPTWKKDNDLLDWLKSL